PDTPGHLPAPLDTETPREALLRLQSACSSAGRLRDKYSVTIGMDLDWLDRSAVGEDETTRRSSTMGLIKGNRRDARWRLAGRSVGDRALQLPLVDAAVAVRLLLAAGQDTRR